MQRTLTCCDRDTAQNRAIGILLITCSPTLVTLTCRSRCIDGSICRESALPAIPPFAPPSISAFTFELHTFLETVYDVATLFLLVLLLVSKWSNWQLLGNEVMVTVNILKIPRGLLGPLSFAFSQIWYVPSFDGKRSAKLQTRAPCGNDDRSEKSSFLEVA